MGKRTIVYIDGFNFYYGCIRDTPHRWLDLYRFAQLLLPKNHVIAVKYFTAIVKPTQRDPTKHVRQLTYLRALRTIPEVQVFLGSFQTHNVRRPLVDGTGVVDVTDTKEKGSDVNLATELLVDAFSGDFDVAAVISNDSDLVAPIRPDDETAQGCRRDQSASDDRGRTEKVCEFSQTDSPIRSETMPIPSNPFGRERNDSQTRWLVSAHTFPSPSGRGWLR